MSATDDWIDAVVQASDEHIMPDEASRMHSMPDAQKIAVARALARAAGYAVVPVDATEAQTRAAAHLDWNAQIDPTWGEIYRVMIAAAEDT